MASRIALSARPIARGAFVVGRQTAPLGRGFSISTTRTQGLKESSGQGCMAIELGVKSQASMTPSLPTTHPSYPRTNSSLPVAGEMSANTSPFKDTDSETHEKHKQDSLSKQKQGKGHWKPELASDSEEAIKADRDEHIDPKKLQEKTAGKAS